MKQVPGIDMSDYGPGARAYWFAGAIVGAMAVAWSLSESLHLDSTALTGMAVMMVIVYLSSLRPIRLHGTTAAITPGDIFMFLTALLWGPPAATLVAALDAFAASCRFSRRWTSRIISPAVTSISILTSSLIFTRLLEWLKQQNLFSAATLLGGLLLFSVVHFLLNTLLYSGLQSLKQKKAWLSVWWSNFAWTSLTSIASSSAAGLIYVAIEQYGMSSLVAAGPLVAIVFATCHFYVKQAQEREKAIEGISRVHLATVEALATAINAKDEITHDHVYRVQVYAAGLARHFGLSELEVEALKAGALLHDVGKIAVPDYILNKPGKLTAAEFEKMKTHTVVGAQIMERVNFPYPVVPVVRHHHERWDGRGYPDGLTGDQIPLTARILSVVDAFDAVREDRQYRKAMTRDEACRFIGDNAGSQFDPTVVSAFLANLPKYEAEIAAHKSELQTVFAQSKQAGISETGARAIPAAGLAQPAGETPEYLKQIHAAHVEVAALHEMAQTFSDKLDVSDVVALTASRLERMIPFTTCVFYMRRERDDSAVAAFAFGKNAEQIRGRTVGAGRGIAGWVIINGRPMSNTDALIDLTELTGVPTDGYRTAAVYPLTNGDATIGALALYSAETDSYGAGHLDLLDSVSRLASTALRHAILNEQTRASSGTDALTGMPTGPALYAGIDRELSVARTRQQPLTALSLRVIGLRMVNETHGYHVGDRVLTEAARVIRSMVGDGGFLGRIAGDEFICLLRDCDRSQAIQLGEILGSEIECLLVEGRPGEYARVRLNFAVEESNENRSAAELLHAIALAARRGPTTQKLRELEQNPTESRMVS
jgi:diguanylate cyclase (GGDEF)-like protein/putative nucleotidyltransferase with HDIG domain